MATRSLFRFATKFGQNGVDPSKQVGLDEFDRRHKNTDYHKLCYGANRSDDLHKLNKLTTEHVRVPDNNTGLSESTSGSGDFPRAYGHVMHPKDIHQYNSACNKLKMHSAPLEHLTALRDNFHRAQECTCPRKRQINGSFVKYCKC